MYVYTDALSRRADMREVADSDDAISAVVAKKEALKERRKSMKTIVTGGIVE